MNNYEEVIERIHASNMHKRESEMNASPSKKHLPCTKMAIATSIACLVCLSVLTITNHQPQPLEMARVNESSHCQNIDCQTTEQSEPQPSPYLPIVHHDDNLTVICLNDCDEKEVLQRFEQTLSSLN